MRTGVDSATQTALLNAFDTGLSVRQLVYVRPRNRTTGEVQGFGFWNGLDTETIGVVDAVTGAQVNRVYEGGGSIPSPDSIGDIPLQAGLDVRSVSIAVSGLHDGVISMLREYDPRQAEIEVHRALLDPVSGLLIGVPQLHFYGRVNTAPLGEGGATESILTMGCTDITSELTRTNPMRRSLEQSARRADALYRYAGVRPNWNIWWGGKAK